MATADALACASCPVRDRAACSVLSEDERADLAAIGRHRTLKRGETLFAAGDSPTSCATLISGALKISSVDEEGVERILSLVHPAGFVGELFAPQAKHSIVALTDSTVCVFPAKRYEEALERFPALGRALLRRSADDLYASRALIDLMGRRTATAKVAGLIKAMAEAASTSPCHPAGSFELPLSREEIAGLLGLTIETVSRQLGRLESEGAIRREGRRGVRLTNAALLDRLAG
ncbi:MAG TPA: Crp/Fnr family transcriptional regulator [Sphingomicrobium sp.]|nr:Crp/Fnr family transcriptional regulator [Sphingomicrobium sp.]